MKVILTSSIWYKYNRIYFFSSIVCLGLLNLILCISVYVDFILLSGILRLVCCVSSQHAPQSLKETDSPAGKGAISYQPQRKGDGSKAS